MESNPATLTVEAFTVQVFVVFNNTRGDRGKPIAVFSFRSQAEIACRLLNKEHGDLETKPFIEPFEFVELELDKI